MTEQPASERRRYWPMLSLIGLFILSRLAFYAAGVTFDLRPIDTSWQILDPVLLRQHLLQSLFYMPGQPPLYNLLLGAVLKISPEPQSTALIFRIIYAAVSLGAVLLLYVLMRRLAVARGFAFAVAAVFMLTPALVLYENIPYYTLLELTLLGAIAWLFHRCVQRCTAGRAFALLFVMAVLIYVRSLFQWEWFVVLAAFCALVLPGHRRQVLTAAALPLLLVFALYGKNLMITGHFATSDWLGMSLSKLSTLALDHDERARMVAAGELSPMALKDAPFKAPDSYPEIFAHTPPTGIPVLDRPLKSTGHVNFNHLAYARVSQIALDDDLATIKYHPLVYLSSVGTAWLEFWRPSSDYPFLYDNRTAIRPYSEVFSKVLAGQPHYPDNPRFDLHMNEIGLFIALGYLLAVAFGLVLIARCLWRRRVSTADATLIFLWLNIMYVSVIGNALEVDENQRFRFAVNPYIATLLVVLASRLIRRFRGPNDGSAAGV